MKTPKKELDKIKKYIIEYYGERHEVNCLGCIVCQIWRAIDDLEQALKLDED